MHGDALTTKERIKNRLDITVTGFDTLLDNLILAVTARLEQMTGRRFAEGTYTNELHDGSDGLSSIRTFLIVKNAPVQSIASIEYKTGTTSAPGWTAFDEDYYEIDYDAGVVHFPTGLPRGFRNIRVTYTGGFSSFAVGISAFWIFNVTPTGTVDGSNLTFTLPENADQVIVYADGIREQSANVTHTDGTATFTLAAGRAPYTTIAVDYISTNTSSTGDITLPADLVEVAEQAVCRIFNRRNSEGRSSEGFQESQITWQKTVFTDEDMATIRNYRRGYSI